MRGTLRRPSTPTGTSPPMMARRTTLLIAVIIERVMLRGTIVQAATSPAWQFQRTV